MDPGNEFWTVKQKKRFPLKGTKHPAGAKVRATLLLSKCFQTYTLEARIVLESPGCPCMKRDLSSLDTLGTKQILLLNWLSLKHPEHCRPLCISFKWRYFVTDNYYLNISMNNTLFCSVYNVEENFYIEKDIVTYRIYLLLLCFKNNSSLNNRTYEKLLFDN